MPVVEAHDIKNCEEVEILSYLQANKLACHSFTDAGKRYEALGLETKNFITHSTTSIVSFMFVLVPFVH